MPETDLNSNRRGDVDNIGRLFDGFIEGTFGSQVGYFDKLNHVVESGWERSFNLVDLFIFSDNSSDAISRLEGV